ncbi:uncharacterized protein LOC142628651 [Castanea sativa]|uniref:uncharacterized protein LOC142628651 n=1 Tax=Castanea sativa TaxID=21020 RepID=UPI003F64DD6A
MGVVSPTLHLKVKYLSGDRVEDLVGSQSMAKQCLAAVIRHQARGWSLVASSREGGASSISEELVVFLKRNIDVFAWSAYKAPGVDSHHLNVNSSAIPKKQPPRHSSKENSVVVREKVIKLKQVGDIKEVFYPEWLANTVVAKKKNEKCFEVYIDDMVVKSKVVSEHVGDLGNTFEILRKHKLRLNASKCSFGVGLGKFLGYMVTHRGIKVNPNQIKAINNSQPPWNPKERVYVDGIANQRGSRVGLVVVSPEKITIEKSLRLGFSASNNEAKYEALLVVMDIVQKMGGRTVEVFLDSRLVVGQVNGELEARDLRMQGYFSQVRHLQSRFKSFTLQKMTRSRITHKDSFSTLATSSVQSLPWVILVENLCKPTKMKREKAYIHQVRAGPSWIDPIVLFLKDDILPEEKREAYKMRRKAPWFWLFEDQKLYKHSFSGPYLLCIHPKGVEPLLEELHKGICGSHMEGKSLSHKVLTQGY